MGRYSDIRRGPQLNQQYIELKKWEELSKAERQTAYAGSMNGPRLLIPRTRKFVIPFSQAADQLYVQLSVIDSAASPPAPANTLIADVAQYIKETIPETSTALRRLTRLVPALLRYKLFTGPESDRVSRTTKSSYKSRPSDVASCPFGKNLATDTEQLVVNALITKANSWVGGSAADKKYYFRKEGDMGI